MLGAAYIFLLLAAQQAATVPSHAAKTDATEQTASARSVQAGEEPDERVATPHAIAPGAPPLLSFRYYEGKLHHRVGNGELMLDDAGH